MMKKTLMIVTLIVLIFLISMGVYYLYLAVPDIIIYGGSDQISFLGREGSLTELLHSVSADVSEIIVINNKNVSMLISDKHLTDFHIKREWGRWHLYSTDPNKKLSNVIQIFMDTSDSDLGIFHLFYAEEIGFHSIYQLVKRKITISNTSNPYQQYGVYDSSSDYLALSIEADSVLFIYESGQEKWVSLVNPGVVQIEMDQLLPAVKNNKGSGILKIVWENPPQLAAYDIYDTLMNAVSKRPTMAVFIDGLGYKLWEHARIEGFAKTFPEMQVNPMRSIYPPKTVYNYYAFGTGSLLTETAPLQRVIFPLFRNLDKKGIIIEGEMQVYSSPLYQKLHIKSHREDNIDNLIFQSAMEIINNYDFIFIHFHDIDNNGHRFGPYSQEVMKAIQNTGNFVSELRKHWDGDLYIFSDHGQHQVYNTELASYEGVHYSGRAEDMIAIFVDLSLPEKQGGNNER